MRLHGYLASLAADGASMDIVRAIIKGPPAGHTVRGLARISGRTVAATARAVRRLEDRGIISVVPDGRSRAVRPNTRGYALKKVLAPAIRAEESSYDAVIEVIRRGIAKNPCSIASAAVFGSTVRGEDHGRSDVDLLVVSDRYEDAIDATMRPASGVYSMFDLSLEPMICAARQFADRKNGYFLSLCQRHGYLTVRAIGRQGDRARSNLASKTKGI